MLASATEALGPAILIRPTCPYYNTPNGASYLSRTRCGISQPHPDSGVLLTPLRRIGTKGSLSLRQRAATVLGGRECLVARHDGELLVVIPGLLGLGWLLDFEQIEVMHHAAVLQHLAALGKHIVNRQFLQFFDHRVRVLGAGGFHGLQILQ